MQQRTITAMLVASALLSGGVYAQASPLAVTSAATATPVPISAPIEGIAGLTAKEIYEQTDLIKVKMRVPQLTGLSDQQFQEEFNRQRVAEAEKVIAEAKETLEEMDAYNKANGYPVRPGELQMDFEVKSAGAILSFTVDQYSYLGGANGLLTRTTYNIDTKENRIIPTLAELFAEFFKEGVDYRSVINAKIADEIKARLAEMPASYFEGEMGFQGITATQGFYIEDEGLVIVFSKYEIAPGATGIPEFSIPAADLQDLLKEDQTKATGVEVVSRKVEVTPLVNQQGVKMIPLRAVCEGLGYQVNWNEEQQMVEIVKGAQWTRVFIGQDDYSFAKMLIKLGSAPIVKDGTTYVPASFAEQVLKATMSTNEGVLTIRQ